MALWSVVIVGSTGMLFDLYRIGTVAVVGGGHGTGLHNILEPASAGLPIVTGPDLGAFREATALEELGALTGRGNVADLPTAWLADIAELPPVWASWKSVVWKPGVGASRENRGALRS